MVVASGSLVYTNRGEKRRRKRKKIGERTHKRVKFFLQVVPHSRVAIGAMSQPFYDDGLDGYKILKC